MGFMDFFKRAVKTIADIPIVHSPIVKGLGSIAGMVAHAIPTVGPVIDAGVTAMNAIFSDDSPPPVSTEGTQKPELDQPMNINLRREDKDITKTLNDSMSVLQVDMEEKYDKISAQINKAVSEVKTMFGHAIYIKVKSQVQSSIQYLTNNKDTLRKITASSNQSVFDLVFDNKEGAGTLPSAMADLEGAIIELETNLQDTTHTPCPSQEMFDLYLMAIHYLLLFHKAIIVTRGLKLKLHRANKQYSYYIETLESLYKDIGKLRDDAKNRFARLSDLVRDIKGRREKYIKFDEFNEERSVLILKDSWPPLSVGWVDRETMQKTAGTLELAVDVKADPPNKATTLATASETFKTSTTGKFYKDIAQRSVEAYLQPAEAVIDSLQQNLHLWNSRLPVTPANLVPGEQHVKPLKSIVDNPETKSTSPLWGKELRYMVTYVNTYGESPVSQLSKAMALSEGEKVSRIELQLHKIKIDNDPLDGIPAIKDANDEDLPPDRGIRRRVYVRYPSTADPNKSVYEFVAEVGEQETACTHHLLSVPAPHVDKPAPPTE